VLWEGTFESEQARVKVLGIYKANTNNPRTPDNGSRGPIQNHLFFGKFGPDVLASFGLCLVRIEHRLMVLGGPWSGTVT